MIIGIGLDVADISRYRFNEERLSWFGRRVYTDEEFAYAMRGRDRPERLAGFFAAKEATRKAFGCAIPWRDVGVTHERSGKPAIVLRGGSAGLAGRMRVERIHLTITHSAGVAAAMVVLEGTSSVPPERD
jgi:holo-[acyl-carrier protein] synthase